MLANSNWCVWKTQQRVGKLLAKNRTCLYSHQLFANSLPTCCYVVHTHQFEFANTRWPTFVWRVKAALRWFPSTALRILSAHHFLAWLARARAHAPSEFDRLSIKAEQFRGITGRFLLNEPRDPHLVIHKVKRHKVKYTMSQFQKKLSTLRYFYLNKWNKKVGSPSSFGRKRPFMSLNCSVFIENLSSSEGACTRACANHARKWCAERMRNAIEGNHLKDETFLGPMWCNSACCMCQCYSLLQLCYIVTLQNKP